jgi:PhzF family phenazine biosynthesis protein
MRTPLFQIDAFSERPFGGNPAAVCLLDGARDERWMQSVAAEMNLSETAFVHPDGDGFSLRWFTPSVEVELCGHATLASAHALWEEGVIERREPARFHTKSGLLAATFRDGLIEMDFPARPESATDAPEGLARALGVVARHVGRSRFDYLVEVESEAAVRAAEPDFRALRALPVRGVILTAPSATAGIDFVSRFFAPGSGVDEDPVTGSAHCTLAPFWSARLHRTELVGYQASRRGGTVRVALRGDRVLLGGRAVTVLRGELLA